MKKVLVVATPLYPPEAGGPATFAKVLEEELPARGFEVRTVKFGEVRHLPKLIRHIAYARRVREALRGADAVLALDPVSVGVPALWAARRAKKPFYLRVGGDYAWEQGTQRFGITDTLDEFVTRRHFPLPVRLLRRVQLRTALAASTVMVQSRYMKNIVIAWGIPEAKIRVVPNAAPEVKQTLPRPQLEGAYLVSIGRLVPWKGMEGLLKAFTGIAAPQYLVIVGDGPERERLEKTVRNEGLSGRVIFTGNLPHTETLGYLAHAEALVLNTRYEGLSHLLLESLAVGTPVLTTPAGGNPELITDRVTGLVFPYDDVNAMREAVQTVRDPALHAELIKNGKALLARFTKEKMIDDVVATLT
jgi:glycosyltransferase involved in cell wall biosynthesis